MKKKFDYFLGIQETLMKIQGDSEWLNSPLTNIFCAALLLYSLFIADNTDSDLLRSVAGYVQWQ